LGHAYIPTVFPFPITIAITIATATANWIYTADPYQ
jgi:hypothetical protein